MNNPHIMHLRSLNPLFGKIQNEDKFVKNKRGITVYGVVNDPDDEETSTVTFSWALQNPKDQYSKKFGRVLAKSRYDSDSIVTVQCDYYPSFPMKYQFFNAVALAREHVKSNPESFSAEDEAFLDLTFGTLSQVAFDNQWFLNVDSSGVPKIHPDIMINFVSRLQTENNISSCNLKQKYLDPLIVQFADKVGRYAM